MSSSAPSEQSSSLSASTSSQAPQSSAQQSTTSEQPTSTTYGPDTLLSVIVEKETAIDTPNRELVIQRRKRLLEDNELFRLREWASLSAEDKNKYPDGLKMMLEKACQSEGKSNNTTICNRLINNTFDEYVYQNRVKG